MKNLIKLFLVTLLVLSSATFYSPVKAAEEVNLYVSSTGANDNDGLSPESAIQTLAKASEIVNADTEGKTFVINVLSNLTMTECARFYNHHVVIRSDNGYVITRGEEFATLSDIARSWYNPAMIEIQANTVESSLTLQNIVFDDNYLYMGTVFSQQVTDGSGDNGQYVQDGIISSNATVKCVITLEEGAVLRNFGGMSAIRATDKAEVVLKSGSKIEDTGDYVRKKSNKETGAAGAIWLQGGKLTTYEGSSITNINGRAVYVDGGEVHLDGTISSITSNTAMWMSTDGYVLHLRNGATGELGSHFLYDGNDTDCKGSAFIINSGTNLEAKNGTVIKNFTNSMAVRVVGNGRLYFDGEITNVKAATANTNVVNIQNGDLTDSGYYVVFGPNSNVHHNTAWYGVFYIQAKAGEVHLYGKINDNYSTDRGGAVTLAHNLSFTTVYMYDGAEMINNHSLKTGGAVMVSRGRFIMNGGTIADNTANSTGGAIYVRNSGQFIMNGGTITGNATTDIGGGIAFEASLWGSEEMPYVQLNGGTISNNYMKATITNEDGDYTFDSTTAVSNDVAISSAGTFAAKQRCLEITNSDVLANQSIYFGVDKKYVEATDLCSANIMLGNAKTEEVNYLKNVSSNNYDWTNYLTSFYAYSTDDITLDISNLSLDSNSPVYALVEEGVAVDQTSALNGDVRVYLTTVEDGKIHLELDKQTENGLGYQILLVQPDYDPGTLTISTIDKLYKDDTLTTYSVPYELTYSFSEELCSILDICQDDIIPSKYSFTFTVYLDGRLEPESVSLESDLLEFVSYSVNNEVLTVNATLSEDWIEYLDQMLDSDVILNVNCLLHSDDFVVGDILEAYAKLEMLDLNTDNAPTSVPSNTCETELCDNIGNLKVTKVVKGKSDDQTAYSIEIELSDSTVNGVYGDVTFTDGVANVRLTADQSVLVEGLKAGLKYTVKELTEGDEEYKVSYQNQQGEIVVADTVEVTVINTYTVTPDTGDYANINLISLVMISSMALLSAVIILKKKYN
ncbi:MAG: DUF5979 domain-containing protein [Erysipelotrichaceae bacterium]